MRRQKKPLKFYLYIFLFSVVIVAGYSLYMIFANDAAISDVYTLWFMPFIFTIFYWGSDALIDKFSKKKYKVNYEAKFLENISQKMRDGKGFLVEEYRKLQNNPKFQEDLKKAYLIYENGEDEIHNIEKLEKKYRKDSVEKRAMKYVTEYLKENKKIPETD